MKNLIALILITLPFIALAQLNVFAGFGDSQLDRSIITHNVGFEYKFENDKGLAIIPRFSFSERGGILVEKREGETTEKEIRTNSLSIAYILRQYVPMNEKGRLFLQTGFSGDTNTTQSTGTQSSITLPVGIGVQFGNVVTWFEYQKNLTGDYNFSGFCLGYSF